MPLPDEGLLSIIAMGCSPFVEQSCANAQFLLDLAHTLATALIQPNGFKLELLALRSFVLSHLEFSLLECIGFSLDSTFSGELHGRPCDYRRYPGRAADN